MSEAGPRASRRVVARLLLALLAAGAASGPVTARARQDAGPAAGWSRGEAADDATLAALADDGRWDEVSARARTVLDDAPDEPVALYWDARAAIARAEVLRGGRRFERDQAESLLARAVSELRRVPAATGGTPADAGDWLLWARFLREDDPALGPDLEAAAAAGSGWASWLRARLAARTGGPEEVDWMRRAAVALPARADVALGLADALSRAGDRAGALAAWEQARGNGAGRAELLGALLALLPAAEDAPEFLARSEPLLAQPDGPRDALLAWYRAWALSRTGRVAEAEAALAAADLGRNPAIEVAQAQFLARLGRSEEGVAHLLGPVADGDPAARSALLDLADGLALKRNWKAARSAYEAVLRVDPEDARAARNLALALAQSGGGLEAYDLLVASPGASADLLNDAALAHAGRGEVLRARELLERALAAGGSDDAVENLAASLLADRPTDPQRAEGLLDGLLAVRPDRSRALVLRQKARQESR